MALSSPGLGSGLDVSSLVSQLMALERRPLTALATKEAKYQAQLTAYGSLKGALSSFQSAVATLANPANFSAAKASLADTSVATASASSAATAGSYSLEVLTLAQPHKLKSANFTATSDVVGSWNPDHTVRHLQRRQLHTQPGQGRRNDCHQAAEVPRWPACATQSTTPMQA